MDIRNCNVTWHSASDGSLGSMPLGNGDLGANVWFTNDGQLHLYLSKTDSWDEYCRLVKLGQITLTSDQPLAKLAQQHYEQTLHLDQGLIEITLGQADQTRLTLQLWIDAHRPTLWLRARGNKAFQLTCSLTTWREKHRKLTEIEGYASMQQDGEREVAYQYPDRVLEAYELGDARVGLAHRNAYSMLPELLRHQGMPELIGQIDDPLRDRTFGVILQGHPSSDAPFKRQDARTVASTTASTNHCLTASVYCDRTATFEDWLTHIERLAADAAGTNADQALTNHAAWWQAFWDRSYIDITGSAAAEAITQGYALQRYVTACAGRGSFPIKFNGSIFTVDGPERDGIRHNADFRLWGGGYWFQNTRLIYWPLLASGDHDMIPPLFNLYEAASPLAEHRCQSQFGIEGLFFPETMLMWGLYRNKDYGFDRPDDLQPGLTDNRYIRLYWQTTIELILLSLEYTAHTGDETWWREHMRPIAMGFLRFIDGFYAQRDADGKLRIEPGQALETWQDAANPTPEIAGLHEILPTMLAMEGAGFTPQERGFLEDLLAALPAIPLGPAEDGRERILPAERFDDLKNMENAELYAVFPYTQGAQGGPLRAQALVAYEHRRLKKVCGWFQDAIDAAMLGLADEAADCLTAMLAPQHASPQQLERRMFARPEDLRFPGFFGPNFDWTPDQDHGGVAMIALQRMLLQTQHGELRTFPAWPDDWAVDFRLHAPGGRVVTGHYQPGSEPVIDITTR